MTVLDMKMGGASSFQPSANQTDQASHAASPEHHNLVGDAGHIVVVLAVLMGMIYALKVLGRVARRGK